MTPYGIFACKWESAAVTGRAQKTYSRCTDPWWGVVHGCRRECARGSSNSRWSSDACTAEQCTECNGSHDIFPWLFYLLFWVPLYSVRGEKVYERRKLFFKNIGKESRKNFLFFACFRVRMQYNKGKPDRRRFR